jgi:YegS/Rv2252/BmrU family lipid kinase
MTESRTKVIINPAAGGGSIRRRWPQIYAQLRDAGLPFDYEFTRGPGHAIEIARLATDGDYRYLIAVGGDGTINEVANGILGSTNSGKAILGMLSTGTAGSFARSLGIAQDYTSLLAKRKTLSIDVGVVECRSRGQRLQRFFVNEASVGFGAAIVSAWSRLPKLFGHSINHKLRTITGYSALVAHRNSWIRLYVGDKFENFHGCYVILANGQYFAGEMQIAPHARLDDGLLNLVTIGDVSKSELLRIVPTVYDGSHIGHPKIRERKVTVVTIESDERLLVEADGEIIGEAPASFSVMPSALAVVV